LICLERRISKIKAFVVIVILHCILVLLYELKQSSIPSLDARYPYLERKELWKIASSDGNDAKAAIDGNLNTVFASETGIPFTYLEITLPALYSVHGLRFTLDKNRVREIQYQEQYLQASCNFFSF